MSTTTTLRSAWSRFTSFLTGDSKETYSDYPWTDDAMEARIAEILERDAKGWAYCRDDVRERYESECG